MKFSVPVAPFVGTVQGVDDVVLSLLQHAPLDQIRFTPATTPELTDVSIESRSTTVEGLVELGISSAATIALQVESSLTCFTVDVLARGEVGNGIEQSLIKSAGVGVGFRIGVVGWKAGSDLKVSTVAQLAASTTLNLASSVFEVSVIGAGLSALPALQPLILGSSSAFDTSTYELLGAVQSGLIEYLASNEDDLTPTLLSVTVESDALIKLAYPAGSDDVTKNALAQTYALERALRNVTLESALADRRVAQNNLDTAVIRYVYEKYLKLGSADPPTAETRREIDRVIHAGRW